MRAGGTLQGRTDGRAETHLHRQRLVSGLPRVRAWQLAGTRLPSGAHGGQERARGMLVRKGRVNSSW